MLWIAEMYSKRVFKVKNSSGTMPPVFAQFSIPNDASADLSMQFESFEIQGYQVPPASSWPVVAYLGRGKTLAWKDIKRKTIRTVADFSRINDPSALSSASGCQGYFCPMDYLIPDLSYKITT